MAMADTVKCQLKVPGQMHFFEQIIANAGTDVVTLNSHHGQRVVIAGAGPSLRELSALPPADEFWACNSALPYLVDHGWPVTHGVTIDQGERMLEPAEWGRARVPAYYCASSVHPRVVQFLRQTGSRVTFFHSLLGVDNPSDWAGAIDSGGQRVTNYELWLYRSLYPTSVQVGHGLNSVPRAVCLALAMGFADIFVVGADCGMPDGAPMPEYGTPAYGAWMDQLVMYADGRTAGQCYGHHDPIAEAVFEGRRWHTRADMVISATHLLELQRDFPGRITLLGDTLPNVMRFEDPEWMAKMPSLTGVGVVDGFGRPDSLTALSATKG
jgi:hypothetical protein